MRTGLLGKTRYPPVGPMLRSGTLGGRLQAQKKRRCYAVPVPHPRMAGRPYRLVAIPQTEGPEPERASAWLAGKMPRPPMNRALALCLQTMMLFVPYAGVYLAIGAVIFLFAYFRR